MINSLLNIGRSALNVSQAWINVTGNNIANVDTEGYHRQYVDQQDIYAINYKPGEMGMGANARQVLRYYDEFLERSYIRQNTNSARWDEHDKVMTSLETLFNESNGNGINNVLNDFFNAWSDFALYPDSTAHRESLLAYAGNLGNILGNTVTQIHRVQDEMSVYIQEGVKRINEISTAIADLNRQIDYNTVDGVNQPNSLYDHRDQLVRELSTLVNVETIDHGKGDFTVQLATGQPLVNGFRKYDMAYLDGIDERNLTLESTYKGNIRSDGLDGFEYTFEIVRGGNATDATPPQFRVSLDGGRTWLKDDDGQELRYNLTDADGDGRVDKQVVKNLIIDFTETDNFTVGDRFTVVPKSGLYWIEPTKGPENVTPQLFLDGTDNGRRVSGGKMAAWFNIRDDNCTRYLDELNAFAKSLIWEVNRQHSQGTGLYRHDSLQGTEVIGDPVQPLGSWQARAAFSDRLMEGDVTFHLYDRATGGHKDSVKMHFDPAKDSLEDVRDRINGLPGGPFTADIQAGRLIIVSADVNTQFHMGEDSSGLMAALGINTFFSGGSAESVATNDMFRINPGWVASGQVNGNHEANVGDPITAQNIGQLSYKDVAISTFWKHTDQQTLSEYYANLVSTVGSDRRLSKSNSEYHGTLTQDLFERTEAVAGVSLDEEMTNLIRFQHSYTAAAKLITTADQMLQTLLGLKQ